MWERHPELIEVLCNLFGSDAKVISATFRPMEIRSFSASTVAVYSVSGFAQVEDQGIRPWTAFLKMLRDPRPDLNEQGWDRELRVYEANIPRQFDSNQMRSPRLLGVARPTGCSARLWLEWIDGTTFMDSKVDVFPTWKLVAESLGTVQGQLVDSASLTSYSWLNTDDLLEWVRSKQDFYPLDTSAATLSKWAKFGDVDLPLRVNEVWGNRDQLLEEIRSLPRTLCHYDVWGGNVLRTDSSVVLVDWQLAGFGAIGGDLPFIVTTEALFRPLEPQAIQALEQTLLDGFKAGLIRSDMLHLLPAATRGFAATAALRYTLVANRLIAEAIEPQHLDGGGGLNPLPNRVHLVEKGVWWAMQVLQR